MRLSRMMVLIVLASFSGLGWAADSVTLTPKWQTDAVFKAPESVAYDEIRHTLYVSNINGAPDSKDGNGFISQVSIDGVIEKLDWITGLDAPKGIAVSGDLLFIADINHLLIADLQQEKIVKTFSAGAESFLNDVVVAPDGAVYVTDTFYDRVYKLHEDQFKLWVESPLLQSPNGIYADENNLYIAAWGVRSDGWNTKIAGHVLTVNLVDKTISSYGASDPVGNLDGIARWSAESLIVSDWFAGELSLIDAKGQISKVVKIAQGTADFMLSQQLQLLVVPSMQEGKLVAYSIE